MLVAAGRGGPRLQEVRDLARRRRVEVVSLGEAELAGRLGAPRSVHNGFAAELASGAASPGAPAGAGGRDEGLVVLVEDVQDPRNLGALVRVCEAAGAGRLLVRDRGSAPLSAAAVKTAAGASEWLPVERIVNSAQAIEELKAAGFWVYGVAPGGDVAWDVDLTGRVALCFGGEEKGLRRRTESLCDRLVGLPMRGRVESLNLATAAAAVLFEAVRQRRAAG